MADKNIMDWDEVIEEDGADFLLVEPGDYNFMVAKFERGEYPGSAKIPKCNRAELTLQVDTPKGMATCFVNLILYRSMEWKLSQFFRSIGQKQKGEKLTMDWSKVPGAVGRGHFNVRTYKDKNGNEKKVNDCDRFLEFDKNNHKDDSWDKIIPVDMKDEEIPFDD